FQAEDGIRDLYVTGVQTCALPISVPDQVTVALGREVGGRVTQPFEDEQALVVGQRLEQIRVEHLAIMLISSLPVQRDVGCGPSRSEERRVGKERGSGWGAAERRRK